MWQGTRILPEGWAKFVSTPAPAWKTPIYGGLFWVNGDGQWNIPKDARTSWPAPAGSGPSSSPHTNWSSCAWATTGALAPGQRALNAAFTQLMAAVKPS